MNEQIKEYLEKYPSEITTMYNTLRNLIFDSAPSEPQETLWAKIPSYYIGDSFVRLIPFKDHINIEAKRTYITINHTLSNPNTILYASLKIGIIAMVYIRQSDRWHSVECRLNSSAHSSRIEQVGSRVGAMIDA